MTLITVRTPTPKPAFSLPIPTLSRNPRFHPISRPCLTPLPNSHTSHNQPISLSLTPRLTHAILTLDIGTSTTKSALYFPNQDDPLSTLARVSHSTQASALQVTQRKQDWLQGAIEAARQALASVSNDIPIPAIAVTGQMQDLIAVGPSPPSLLCIDSILYSDARAFQSAQKLSALCNLPLDATSIPAKLTLLPASPSPTHYSLLLGAADYILYEFSAHPKPLVTDATTASTTGLTLPPHRSYNTKLLSKAHLLDFVPLLPSILNAPQVVGRLSRDIAQQLQRPDLSGTPLVHAGGDAYSTTAGAGRETMGGGYIYCGTSGWIGGSLPANEPMKPGVFGLGHAEHSGMQIALASLSTAGGNLTFGGNVLLGGIDEAEVGQLAKGADIGAGGLVYVPYIGGRRCPRPCATASGGLFGLRMSTRRAEVARALVEGLVFAFAEAGKELGTDGILGKRELLRMVGGGVGCEVLVRGIAALVAGDGGVQVEQVGGGVGVRGAGRIGERVVCGSGGEGGWRGGRVVRVGAAERAEWERAWDRWRGVVERVEEI